MYSFDMFTYLYNKELHLSERLSNRHLSVFEVAQARQLCIENTNLPH